MRAEMRRLGPRAVTIALITLASAGLLSQEQRAAAADTTPPSIAYGDLYRAVELGGVFPDSKTFPDMIPDAKPAEIVKRYHAEKAKPDFDLAAFVHRHFTGPTPPGPTVEPAAADEHLLAYVHRLWAALRQSEPKVPPYATLQPLPHPYVVPGGRFREVYYWDSYFTMLGLEGDGEDALAHDMLKNFAVETDRYGLIPNGNRSYYLSRSQPPFFSLMVSLAAEHGGAKALAAYRAELAKEWAFWMAGAATLKGAGVARNVVRLADGTILNRYWDARDAPRDESYKEDVATAATSNRPAGQVWRDLRAAAESGWDFSSRWLGDGTTLATVRTLGMIPVDLNALLVHLERTLAESYRQGGDAGQAAIFLRRAERRAAAIRRLLWSPEAGVFTDYLIEQGRTTGAVTAATLYPLFLKIATPEQAKIVAQTVREKLLDVGGLATTLSTSGQQWDAPNGWAPLQWIAVTGLRNYGEEDLAKEVAERWVHKNIAGFAQTAKLVEKYNVTTTGGDAGGGGEYATQIGFGWTNGVLVALANLYPELRTEAEAAVPNNQAAPQQ
jgi:alpha,alpha-trehalase